MEGVLFQGLRVAVERRLRLPQRFQHHPGVEQRLLILRCQTPGYSAGLKRRLRTPEAKAQGRNGMPQGDLALPAADVLCHSLEGRQGGFGMPLPIKIDGLP